MTNEKTFELLRLPEGVYEYIVNISVVVFLVCIFALIATKFAKKDLRKGLRTIIFGICNISKLIVCGVAVFLVFFFDYETRSIVGFHCDDMLATTFFVGILALIEIFVTITAIVKDLLDQ